MAEKKLTYAKAYEEMESLMLQLQSDHINDLDEMVKKVDRITELIAFCREKLRKAETEMLEKISKTEN